MGFLDGLKKGASDLFAVGQQVVGMAFDTGAAALAGAKTLVTDPKKFAEDVAYGAAEFGRHASNSFSDGARMIGEGWEEAWAAGNPGMFLWKAVGGTAQIASLGATDAIKEHVAKVSSVARDELGNMTGFEIGEDCDAITRVMLEHGGGWASTVVNGDAEVKEAIAEGDTEKANKLFGSMVGRAVAKPVGTAAMVAGAAVVIAGTGGAAAPAIGTALSVGGGLANMHAGKVQVDFDLENAADDIKDKVDAELAVLRAGGLSEEDAARYGEIMTAYYQGAAYTGSGDRLGASQLGEGATNQDLKAWMLQAAGLDEKVELAASRYEASLSAGTSVQPQALAESPGLDGVARALEGMSAEDQEAVMAFIADRRQASGLAASVESRDPESAAPQLPAAEQPGGTEHAEDAVGEPAAGGLAYA